MEWHCYLFCDVCSTGLVLLLVLGSQICLLAATDISHIRCLRDDRESYLLIIAYYFNRTSPVKKRLGRKAGAIGWTKIHTDVLCQTGDYN